MWHFRHTKHVVRNLLNRTPVTLYYARARLVFLLKIFFFSVPSSLVCYCNNTALSVARHLYGRVPIHFSNDYCTPIHGGRARVSNTAVSWPPYGMSNVAGLRNPQQDQIHFIHGLNRLVYKREQRRRLGGAYGPCPPPP